MRIDTTKPVSRAGNKFCGPLTIAAITDATPGEAAELIFDCADRSKRHRSLKSPAGVKGIYNTEMLAVLRGLGYRCFWESGIASATYIRFIGMTRRTVTDGAPYSSLIWKIKRRTLRTFVAKLDPALTVVVQLRGHYILIHDGKLCDTYTNGAWVAFADAPHMTKPIYNYMIVEL